LIQKTLKKEKKIKNEPKKFRKRTKMNQKTNFVYRTTTKNHQNYDESPLIYSFPS